MIIKCHGCGQVEHNFDTTDFLYGMEQECRCGFWTKPTLAEKVEAILKHFEKENIKI